MHKHLLAAGFFLLHAAAFGQATEFALPIQVSDGISTLDMIIGMRDDATDGRDRRIDAAVPPPPPAEFLWAYITGGGSALWWDYRAVSADTTRYWLAIDPNDSTQNPVIIRWDESVDLAALGSFHIKNALPEQAGFDLDMSTVDSLDTSGPPDLSGGVLIEVVLNGSGGGAITLPAVEDAYVRGGGAKVAGGHD